MGCVVWHGKNYGVVRSMKSREKNRRFLKWSSFPYDCVYRRFYPFLFYFIFYGVKWSFSLAELSLAMEIGCVLPSPIPMVSSSSSSLTPSISFSLSSPTSREPLSVNFSDKPRPNLRRVSLTRRRSLSTAASPSPPSHLVPEDLGFEFEEAVERTEAPTKSSKVILNGMSYTELQVRLLKVQYSFSVCLLVSSFENGGLCDRNGFNREDSDLDRLWCCGNVCTATIFGHTTSTN